MNDYVSIAIAIVIALVLIYFLMTWRSDSTKREAMHKVVVVAMRGCPHCQSMLEDYPRLKKYVLFFGEGEPTHAAALDYLVTTGARSVPVVIQVVGDKSVVKSMGYESSKDKAAVGKMLDEMGI